MCFFLFLANPLYAFGKKFNFTMRLPVLKIILSVETCSRVILFCKYCICMRNFVDENSMEYNLKFFLKLYGVRKFSYFCTEN